MALAALSGGRPAMAADCSPAVARVVSAQGVVEVRRLESGPWTAAAAEHELCAGDALRVGEHGRAAVRLANQSTLRLDQFTTLTLGQPERDTTLIDLLRGAIHVITRTPRPFRVRTPVVNAGVEGTEFGVRAQGDAVRIVVVEGRVRASNERGTVDLDGGSEAIVDRGSAPEARRVLRPADAVHWALYYPRVVGIHAGDDPELRESEALASRGATDQALARVDALPAARRGARHLAWRAELLLRVGRVDEAAAAIAEALRAEPGSPDARALQSVIALVQNDREPALRLAREAVALDRLSAAAQLALSYAEQARYDIPAARQAAEAAAALPGADELAWARVAELRLAMGDSAEALAAARRAAAMDANLARTQTVLGFVHLARAAAAEAAAAFERAIASDQGDHLPRLGLGLAKVRAGDLAAGREAIEIAASLDPLNSLVRSYLGKAYFEERRDPLATTQYDLAKRFDPQDPTPWTYEAILQHAENRPVQALQGLEKSIELNDRRAVSRSRLLLDQDRATRQITLASVYAELGAEREALAVAARSLADDPANATAHRFLSEIYATRERHDIARTSELLQAQLLQPPGLNPPTPELPFTDLGLPLSAGQSAIFANDSAGVFERDGAAGYLGVLGGNLGTWAGRARAALQQGAFALSAGAFEYRTDGFRPNAGLRHRIGDALVQFAATPELSLQAEWRDRRTRNGDLALRFDPQAFSERQHASVEERSARLGVTYRAGAETTWLVSAMDVQRQDAQLFAAAGQPDGVFDFDNRVRAYELQLQHRLGAANLVLGAGQLRNRSTTAVGFDFTPLLGIACPPDFEPCAGVLDERVEQWNAYAYAHVRPTATLAATLGLSREHYVDATTRLDRWNPKLGLRWDATPALSMRAATFSTLKRALAARQTIEPTQVAGFNQLYDDVLGTVSRFHVAGLDWRASPAVSLGAELGRQHARAGTGTIGTEFGAIPAQHLYTDWMRVDLSARPSSTAVFSAALLAERFHWDNLFGDDSPTKLMTTRLPLALRSFLGGGYFGEVVVTGVAQRVRRAATSAVPAGSERFAVVDLSLGWRLPSRWGTVSLDVKNLFGSSFSYQDDSFRSTESRLPAFVPVRRLWLRANLVL